jgi:hypothetical protein
MPGDLKNAKLIHLKGWLFLAIGLMAGAIIVAEILSWRIAILLALCVWACARFYYYAFYVIQHYVDPAYKFAGLLDFAHYLLRRPPPVPPGPPASPPDRP